MNAADLARKGYTKTYWVYCGMLARCYHKNHKSYPRYGGRGITVDERWRGENGYYNFINDMGEPPTGYTIDRIENDGPYSKDNCRWSTRAAQNNNTSQNVRITYNGETLTLTEWARRLGTNITTVRNRIKLYGWSQEEAVSTPVGPKGCNRRLPRA